MDGNIKSASVYTISAEETLNDFPFPLSTYINDFILNIKLFVPIPTHKQRVK